ncbi:hypothetical protein Tco_0918978, partial [Tanacetum coccineum]
MSTSKTYQQSLAEAGSETRPPMLERGSYIPWASRFKRFLNRKRENRKWLLKALEDGPYVFRNITPTGSTLPRLQEVEDLQGDDLLYYDAEMELTNMILLSIPNEIYNSVDSCKTAKEMWDRVERLMRGTIQNQVDRETRFTNEFDQFVAEPGESLVSVYNRFAQLMNDLERNNMKFPTVSVNTKFLNSLQPEWLKYVTQVRLAKKLTVDSFDDLFDYLSQFEKLVYASRAKKLEKSHDPLALVAYTGLSSKNTSSYYATHPSSVVDYDEEYEQDDVHNHSEDPLASAMLLLSKAITQNFSNPTNNRVFVLRLIPEIKQSFKLAVLGGSLLGNFLSVKVILVLRGGKNMTAFSDFDLLDTVVAYHNMGLSVLDFRNLMRGQARSQQACQSSSKQSAGRSVYHLPGGVSGHLEHLLFSDSNLRKDGIFEDIVRRSFSFGDTDLPIDDIAAALLL